MKTYAIDDMRFIVGTNAGENAYMVAMAKPYHVWFHLSDFPSPHGILEVPEGYKISGETMEKCALLVKTNSKHKNAQRVSIDTLEIRYVEPVKTRLGAVNLHKNPKKIKI